MVITANYETTSGMSMQHSVYKAWKPSYGAGLNTLIPGGGIEEEFKFTADIYPFIYRFL